MLVSILIPCFNAENWIAQAIESALAQTWPDKEVIVVDDGSTDHSLDIIRRFEGRIHWETGPNRGGNAARNRLLELANGEWLQYLDADDYLLPEKIRRQAEFVADHPEADIVYSPTYCEKMKDGRLFLYEEPLPNPMDPWAQLALWYLPQTGGPLWKRTALQRVNGWRVEQPCCQEHELYFRLLATGCCFVFFDDRSSVYRAWDIAGRLTTVRRKDLPRERLIILDRMEAFLAESNMLLRNRLQAINDARHQLARAAWHEDHVRAAAIALRITQSDRCYCPTDSIVSPLYRLAYRLFGFRRAQIIGDIRRRLVGRDTTFGYG